MRNKYQIRLLLLLLLSLEGYYLSAQCKLDKVLAEKCFSEIKINTAKNKELWNLDLYAPILLVDPNNRQLYANEPDSCGFLSKDGELFIGILPDNVSCANTAIEWNGKRWTMVMVIPDYKSDRLDLFSHELFHYHQPKLGFEMSNPSNVHLDKKDGRIYIRLELEALIKAYKSRNKRQRLEHLTNAFVFRTLRYKLYDGAKEEENLLELNEGLASYTGMFMSNRNDVEMKRYLETQLNAFFNNPSFVRSFAYITVPLYGFILNDIDSSWNKKINSKTNLTDFFRETFDIYITEDFINCDSKIKNHYEFDKINTEEIAREKAIEEKMTYYKGLFIENTHLTIYFENMSIAFDPRSVISFEGYGSVYPNLRVTDDWGILNVSGGGALLSSDWSNIVVSQPTKIENNVVEGNGWTLELNSGYMIRTNGDGGNSFIEKVVVDK